MLRHFLCQPLSNRLRIYNGEKKFVARASWKNERSRYKPRFLAQQCKCDGITCSRSPCLERGRNIQSCYSRATQTTFSPAHQDRTPASYSPPAGRDIRSHGRSWDPDSRSRPNVQRNTKRCDSCRSRARRESPPDLVTNIP